MAFGDKKTERLVFICKDVDLLNLKTTSHYDSSVDIFHEYVMVNNGMYAQEQI